MPPLRRYLPPELTVKEIHNFFKEANPSTKVGYESYRRIFKKQNISFTKLGEEECEVCEIYRQHLDTCKRKQPDCPDESGDVDDEVSKIEDGTQRNIKRGGKRGRKGGKRLTRISTNSGIGSRKRRKVIEVASGN